ncbi:MAG TPA: efflux RND transporter permease subunit, partial [Bacteroidetes bacterium]|nr:efflux RND transporter permease subunit [Bacteroidota bacterium]
PVQQIDLTIRTAIAGTEVTSFRTDEGKEYPVVLRMPEGDSVRLSHLDRIHITSVTGRQVPLRQLAAWELRRAPGVISHTGLERCATLTADIEKGYFLDQVIDSLEKKLEGFRWPAGYTYKYTGELESREESFAGVARASLLAVLAILAILVLQFRSFTRPFIIFTALPLAFIGACLGLYLTGNSFSFTAAIGFISLIGIVVNNSILLVDYTTLLTGEGKGLKEAIMEAGETRFRPIVLTTLTTVGGLLPLTLRGGTLWAPMGWTIIGGLLVSTFLTLIVVPALYLLFTRFGRQVESITTG